MARLDVARVTKLRRAIAETKAAQEPVDTVVNAALVRRWQHQRCSGFPGTRLWLTLTRFPSCTA